jgi:succinate dehydrogenase/fumarate reductase-like Fe-S protein
MVDGTGMCGGCRVKIGNEVKFACVDGPDFDGHKVDFNDLMMRLRRYAAEEKAALDRWSESCRMMQQVPPVLQAEATETAMVLPDPFEETLGG